MAGCRAAGKRGELQLVPGADRGKETWERETWVHEWERTCGYLAEEFAGG